MNTTIEEVEYEDSELTNEYEDDKYNLYYHFEESDWFQGVHQTIGVPQNKGLMFNKTFEKSVSRFFSNITTTKI